MSAKASEVRGVMVPITDGNIVLPNSCVQEVITYSEPERFDNPSEWLLGSILWQGWQVPVIAYANLIGLSGPEATDGSRIMIIKSLLDSRRLPYIGILVRALPKLVAITADILIEQTGRQSLGVYAHVSVDDQNAVIPDLDRLSQLVVHAAYGALPVAKI